MAISNNRKHIQNFSLEEFISNTADLLQSSTLAPNIKKYQPHEKQHTFHTSTHKSKLYIGGNRSGKSVGGVIEALWRATCTHPYRPDLNALGPTRGRVVAVDFVNGVEQIIFPIYKQWVLPSSLRGGSWDRAYDKTLRTLFFANGSQIEFKSYDQDLDKFAGVSRHWTHFDEEPPKPIWLECLARLIDTDGDWWLTMTPVEGVTWVYDDIFSPNYELPVEEQDTRIIQINTLENPFLSQRAIADFAKQIDNDDIETRIGGGFVQKGGKIFKDFDYKPGGRHVLPDGFLQKVPPNELATVFDPKQWLWIMCLDHGLNNPTAVLWLAVDPGGFIIVFDEYYHAERSIKQNADGIKAKIREHGRFPDLLVADPSIRNRNPTSMTSIHEEYQKYGLSFIDGNNDVKSGIVRMKKYFEAAPYPVSHSRVPKFWLKHGFLKEEHLSVIGRKVPYIQRMLISPACRNLIWELKKYRWKTYQNKKLQYENNPYDEPHKKDDHACDALRYAIMTRPDLSSTDNTPSEETLDKIMENLQMRIGSHDPDMADVADPYDMLNPRQIENMSQAGWDAMHSSLPTGDHNNGWEYDDHMGDLY